MNEKFYQVCYTRVGVQEGWRTINTSVGIPQQLVSVFEKAEVGNEVKRGIPLDVKGKSLWMLEIISGQGCVGLSRTQYGLSDPFGRSNFFSQAFLFLNAYEMLKNPGNLLEISDDNFKTGVEEAEKVPLTLKMNSQMSIEKALEICGMTREKYVLYIQCIYYALSTNTNSTIYVCTDGSDTMVRNLLYLTYCAIPYSLRTKITAATCTDLENPNQMLIFGKTIPEYSRFVNPRTGQNNILTTAIEKRWQRNPFITYFAEHYEEIEKNEIIYQNMEKWLEKMGNVELNNMDTLRLAYMMYGLELEKVKDEDVTGLLYDWIALPIVNSEVLEQYFGTFLNEVVDRKIKLGQETEVMLQDRVKSAITEQFRESYLQYLSFVLAQGEKEEGYVYLRGLGKESSVFRKMREMLLASQEGKQLLIGFYRENIQLTIENPDCKQEDLIEDYYDCEDIPAIVSEVKEILHKKNEELARKELQQTNAFWETLKHYKETEQAIKRKYAVSKVLVMDYDLLVKTHFQTEKMLEYEKFYYKYSAHFPELGCMGTFLQTMRALEEENYGAVEAFLESEYIERIDSDLIEILFKYALQQEVEKKCVSMSFWGKFAKVRKVPLVKMLIQNKVEVLCNPYELKDSLNRDIDYWSTERIEIFYEKCQSYMERSDKKDVLRESYEVLKAELKQREAEEKYRQKEAKKREKLAHKLEKKNKRERKVSEWPDLEEVEELWMPEKQEEQEEKRSAASAVKGWIGGLFKK